MHLTRWDWPHTIRDMSDPDIGTLSVRFSVEERRLLEDFARISGVTVEGLIREALFLPPREARTRQHLRVVRSATPQHGEAPAGQARAKGWRRGVLGTAPRSPASPVVAHRD
jgi:hypothetical protein